MTPAPRSAIRMAAACPMPELAPVMTAILMLAPPSWSGCFNPTSTGGPSVRLNRSSSCTILLSSSQTPEFEAAAPSNGVYISVLVSEIGAQSAGGGDSAVRRQLGQLRTLIARHARPDETTAIDGVLLSSADTTGDPRTATSGTVFA